MKSKVIWLLILFSVVSFKEPEIEGKITAVKDGDTVELLHGKTRIKIRFFGIDCPELHQDFGQKAKTYTSALCFGKEVKLLVKGKDYFGRTLGEVILPNGENLNQELVKAGMAWHFKKYSSSETLEKLQMKAKSERIGLWSHPNPIPPWEFRKIRRKNSKK